MNESDQKQFWKSVCSAVDAEPRDYSIIRGISGLDHPVQAIAVDELRDRVIIVSAEQNPRVAALMQVDIQATMPKTKVIVSRPIAFDISSIARKVAEFLPSRRLNYVGISELAVLLQSKTEKEKQKFFEDVMTPFLRSASIASIPILTNVIEVIQQLSYLKLDEVKVQIEAARLNSKFSLEKIIDIDNLSNDRKFGICPFPVYSLSEMDYNCIIQSGRKQDVIDILKKIDVYQYFYPPKDSVTLGIIDSAVSWESDIENILALSPEIGHPFGENELVSSQGIREIVDDLGSLGYIVEGEHGIEISEKGKTVRTNFKFKPRESLIVKLLNRFSFNVGVNPKDYL